ncbi:hypothetical protein Trydic_g21841 [Trypoxylus dichotomus]
MKGILYFTAIAVTLFIKVIADDVSARAYCPPSGQHFFPHPYRCSQFITCDNGEYRIVDCIEGLHFNPTFGWCDSPEAVGCAEANDKTGPAADPEYEEPGNSDDQTPNEENSEDDGNCPPSGQHFLPHPYDCSLFIECNNGRYSVLDCIDGLYFNRKLGWCDFPENVACVNAKPTPKAPNDNDGPDGSCPLNNNPATVYFLADRRDCSVFYKCDWGVPIAKACSPGLHFNRVLNVCDWPWNAGCTAGQ